MGTCGTTFVATERRHASVVGRGSIEFQTAYDTLLGKSGATNTIERVELEKHAGAFN
jgi:hypothetical protein